MIDEKKLIKEIRNMVLPLTIPEIDDGTTQAYNEALVDVLTAIEEQPKVGKWIPVEERLPDEDGEYLVYYSCEIDRSVGEDKECGYWIVNFDTDMEAFGEWQNIYHPVSLGFLDSEFNEMNTVVAWMPLPEPYVKD